MNAFERPADRPVEGGGRIAALDGVRGLAVLLILIFHYGGGSQSSHPALRIAGAFCQFAWSGVSLFFVLSGFLITGILWDGKGHSRWWHRFYARRVLRIFPLYYFALLLAVACAPWRGMVATQARSFAPYFLFLNNLPLYLTSNTVVSALRLTHLWSLATEEQFYLVWPLVLFLCRSRLTARRVCSLLFVGSMLYRAVGVEAGIPAIDRYFLSRAGDLAAGGWLALSLRGPQAEWERILRFAAPMLGGTALSLALIGARNRGSSDTGLLMVSVGLALLTLMFGSLIAMAVGSAGRKSAAAKMLEAPVLRWMGTRSYGIYVYHILFLGLYTGLARSLAGGGGYGRIALLRAVVGIPLSVLAAEISLRFLERPFLRLKERFAARRVPDTRSSERTDRASV